MAKKKVTRYTYEDVLEPRSPETGDTSLLPSDEDSVVVEMDPLQDPVLHWSGKKTRKTVPILPLQRNEIVSESRIAQIIERVQTGAAKKDGQQAQGWLFADWERELRKAEREKRVEFYKHEEGWRNKLICGDSLEVMESLLHYDALRGKVQMIYMDPPYAIDYDSNFQQRVDSTKNDAKDRADDVVTIKAFRDTWVLGVHSYLSYLQERMYLCREILHETGSIFVQINDENQHLVRVLLDEVFGAQNFVALIPFRKKTMPMGTIFLEQMADFILWYAKSKFDSAGRKVAKYHPLHTAKNVEGEFHWNWYELPDGSRCRMTSDENKSHSLLPKGARIYRLQPMEPAGPMESGRYVYEYEGRPFNPPANGFSVTKEGMDRLARAGRLQVEGNRLRFITYFDQAATSPITAPWHDTVGADDKQYVVQTNSNVVGRCILMTTDPGDLVLDPTSGGGTTAIAAERLARRWIAIDTSRVAVNVARGRLLSALFPHYMLRGKSPSDGIAVRTTKRVTIGSIANDKEPLTIELSNEPIVDGSAIRVCGPFEVMTIGRYSIEDWKGYVRESGKLENYIEVICRLYRQDAAVQGANGLVHAVAETEDEKIAISVGPLSGRVTAKQLVDAAEDALSSGIAALHVLGWAFEANVGEVKLALEAAKNVSIQLIMIRPDTLAEGLKASARESLFSPLGLPDIELSVSPGKDGEEPRATVTLNGLALYDRKARTTDYKQADSGYVSAWYLDEDYDRDCFVDCQMFFDFSRAPNLKAALGLEIDPNEYRLQLTSRPFPIRSYKCLAVKVVDVFGNESTIVRDLP